MPKPEEHATVQQQVELPTTTQEPFLAEKGRVISFFAKSFQNNITSKTACQALQALLGFSVFNLKFNNTV